MKQIIISIIVVLFCCISKVLAAGNIHIGTLEIHPFESVSRTYNDNIYREPKNQENGDQITVSQFGILFKKAIVPGRDYRFKAEYFADVFQYNKNPREDRVDHTVDARIDFYFPNRLLIKMREKYKKTADPPNSELTDLEKRIRNVNEAVLGYKGKQFSFEVSSRYMRDNYDKLDNLDKKEYVTTQTAYINISPKTSLFVEYVFGKFRYDENSTNQDSEYSQWRAGIKGTITPKLTGIIKGGYKETDYDDTRTINGRDYRGGTAFVRIVYKVKERSSITFYGDRTSVESTYLTNNYYVENKAGGIIDHQLTKRIFFTGEGFFGKNTYPEELTDGGKTEKRKDRVQGANTELRFKVFEWLSLHGGYRYSRKNSNFTRYEYKNNIYSAKIAVMF